MGGSRPIACFAKDDQNTGGSDERYCLSEPVTLSLPGIGPRKVATSYEALDGWCSAQSARRSFVKAAVRAGFLRNSQPSRLPGATGSAARVGMANPSIQ